MKNLLWLLPLAAGVVLAFALPIRALSAQNVAPAGTYQMACTNNIGGRCWIIDTRTGQFREARL